MFTNFELYLIDSLYSYISHDLETSDFEYQYEFIKKNLYSYINYTSLENVYYDIICTYDIDDINKAKNMIKNILYYYFLANPNESLNIDLLVNKFLSDEEFGIKVLKTFYLAIFNLNQLEIMENNYKKFNSNKYNIVKYLKYEIGSLNDKIRFNIKLIFNLLSVISNNIYTKTLILKIILLSDNNLIEFESLTFLKAYYPYFVRLMYTDIYEYTSFDNDKDAKIVNNSVLNILEDENINFNDPKYLDEKYLLIYIAILNKNIERKEIRNYLSEDNLVLIRKNNPLYMFDEI